MRRCVRLPRRYVVGVMLSMVLVPLCACLPHPAGTKPTIEITQVPVSSIGGPTEMREIAGRVYHAKPGQQVVLYAHSGVWWIQPLTGEPFTVIRNDSSWKNSTHLGTEYAALLADPGYQPALKMVTLPVPGDGVAAVAIVRGKAGSPNVEPVVHFSGYDWLTRSTIGDHGGEPNAYDPANVWIDEHQSLHLRMGEHQGHWSCAEVNLTHSLGYGTYRFVVQDTKGLSPSAVLGFFIWDDLRSEGFHSEFDIELSRWDNPAAKNAQYVVQPFYARQNFFRFDVPAGLLTLLFQWAPGELLFQSFRGADLTPENLVREHRFTSEIPTPASETVHVDLYDFHHVEFPSHPPAEVVVRSFEFVALGQ